MCDATWEIINLTFVSSNLKSVLYISNFELMRHRRANYIRFVKYFNTILLLVLVKIVLNKAHDTKR